MESHFLCTRVKWKKTEAEPQDGLISQSSLKRAQKINRIEFWLSFVWIPIHVLPNQKED